MVLSANKINYKGEPGVNTNYHVTRDNTNSRQSKSPQTYSDSWYVRETTTYGSSSAGAVDKEQIGYSCWCWSKSAGAAEPAMRYTNGPQSAASMVASYGVYNDATLRSDEDDDGFIPRANLYRGVVVNAAGDSSVVRASHLQQEPAPTEADSCGWCFGSQTPSTTPEARNSCLVSWCRPTILLLILVLLVVVFVLVSGILLYFNCTFKCFYVCMLTQSFDVKTCSLHIHQNTFPLPAPIY
ncbi:hypothetical protein BDFB_000528 [Asbolus verrucosus]|uniref:Uncharacterized protein n=1 Tax=Asbolus verrucosus TaxID=1661398 RepID=A0A482W8H8_ASBVE|nr:hypothetical protein BDFB_000528 [Asbolus verrucosus]